MSIDTIGNFITIIRNGIMRSKPSVAASYSKVRHDLTKILLDEGFIDGFDLVGDGINKEIKISLKYVSGESAIHEITRVSKPSRRVYARIRNVKPVIGGLGISLITTNKGLLTDKTAKQLKVGGEVICTVW